MRGQQGLTITGFLVTAVILVIIALLGFQIAPPYMEYYTIQKQIKIVAGEFQGTGIQRRPVEIAFDKRANVENITAIQGKDIEITKDGDKVTLTAEYSVKVPLVGNLSACMDFRASSDK